jgi:3-isopropylmalate dehydrogenase
MMLDHLGLDGAARTIERAVVACLEAGECTRDLGGNLGAAGAGDAVVRRIERSA